MIDAHLLLASKNRMTGDILYTFVLRYPRIILPEVLTHRVASRNTASSRAIPTKKYLKDVWTHPFVPLSFGKNQKGMQAGADLEGWRAKLAEAVWNGARIPAIFSAWALTKLGVHKQVANRLVEPWVWTTQLFSATELDNFFDLRVHKDAEPHIRVLAAMMKLLVQNAKRDFAEMEELGVNRVELEEGTVLQVLGEGEWHLPFVREDDEYAPYLDIAKKISAARSARVSYRVPETGQVSDIGRDLDLFERLVGSEPIHASPTEHQAAPLPTSEFSGNFKGWKQFRKEIEEKTTA